MHLEAAKELGVPAPELMNLPVTWRDWAVDAISARNFAQGELQRRAAQKRGKGKR